MRILFLSLILFALSACFAVGLDLLLKYDLRSSLHNMTMPFRYMMKQEIVIMTIIVLYAFFRPYIYRLAKRMWQSFQNQPRA
ncbi:hypothetical protein [Paenibacillus sp.]|uniref:hypothetical protein n=1 Tax=Paenibacillus sp. TaxID=58172 RepID=UPI0028115A8E|nr:hypothetical protein [Paenibacillus sp.]